MFKKIKFSIVAVILSTSFVIANADDYVIDTKGSHAFVQFRAKHLGYSWLYGRFNKFSGTFTFDEADPSKNKVNVEIDTTSLDSNHAERDKHLKSSDFLNVDKYPKATFESTAYKSTGSNTGQITGNLTFHGVTKEIIIDVEHIGGGDDPWGGYRQGFEGTAVISPDEFGIDAVANLGPALATVELMLTAEGIRK